MPGVEEFSTPQIWHIDMVILWLYNGYIMVILCYMMLHYVLFMDTNP